MPVLLLAGALDSKYVTLAEQMAPLIPQATINVISAAGHNIHLEQPDVFCGTNRNVGRSTWDVARGT